MERLLLAVARLDDHRCTPAHFSQVAKAVHDAAERATRLSDRAYTQMLLAVMKRKAHARIHDPIPHHALKERMR